MEFENAFSRSGKIMDSKNTAEVMEKSRNFIFWSKYYVLFENWKRSLYRRAKLCPKRLGFQHFLVMENLNCL